MAVEESSVGLSRAMMLVSDRNSGLVSTRHSYCSIIVRVSSRNDKTHR
jgi:hypothetical protein